MYGIPKHLLLTIRRIVQTTEGIFKIEPGLYALNKYQKEFIEQGIFLRNTAKDEIFSHSYYQALLLEIGKMRKFLTYAPAQDKKKKYLQTTIGQIANTTEIPPFTFANIINRARTVDVIWFNERKMPSAFFEVEHSTDIQNSLLKFYELQDFNAQFKIDASDLRKPEFEKKLNYSSFKAIKDKVNFLSYEELSQIHTYYSKLVSQKLTLNL